MDCAPKESAKRRQSYPASLLEWLIEVTTNAVNGGTRGYLQLQRRYRGGGEFPGGTGGRAHRVWGHLVTSSYFATLRVNPALGRFFDWQDEQPGRAPSVVLSYEFWRNQMGSDPTAILGALEGDTCPR